MSTASRFLRIAEGGRVSFWCPGCNEAHTIQVGEGSPPRWGYNGNPNAPTFTPSVRVSDDERTLCHSFVTDGRIQFLDDCRHALAGQTVALAQWPHRDAAEGDR